MSCHSTGTGYTSAVLSIPKDRIPVRQYCVSIAKYTDANFGGLEAGSEKLLLRASCVLKSNSPFQSLWKEASISAYATSA